MTGSLQKKKMRSGNSYYYAVLNINGKAKWIPTGLQVTGNKRLAQKKFQEILATYSSKDESAMTTSASAKSRKYIKFPDKAPEPVENILFSDWIKRWLDSRKTDIRECTSESYATHAKAVISYFKEKEIKLAEITYSDIEEYCKYMLANGKINRYSGIRTGYAVRTVRSQKFIITSALNWAVHQKLIPNNPALNVTVSRKKNRQLAKKPVFFTAIEANQYLKFLKDKNDLLYDMIYVTLTYGLRRSEVLGLTEQSVDFKHNKLYINRTIVKMIHLHDENATKTFDSEREYPLTKEMRIFFQEIIARKRKYQSLYKNKYIETEFLFTWEDGKPFLPDYVSKHHKKMVAAFGKPDLTFHNLRHSTACILYEQGWKAKDIQEWLGHADIITTMNIYTHIDRAHKQKQAESLNGVLHYDISTDDQKELLK